MRIKSFFLDKETVSYLTDSGETFYSTLQESKMYKSFFPKIHKLFYSNMLFLQHLNKSRGFQGYL